MSLEVEAMTNVEVANELLLLQEHFTSEDFDRLEWKLKLKAGCLGWTGNPLKQPPRSVLAVAREVIAEKKGGAQP